MMDRTHTLSVPNQAKALGISRGCLYDRPKAVFDSVQTLMPRLDQWHRDLPVAGARMLRDL